MKKISFPHPDTLDRIRRFIATHQGGIGPNERIYLISLAGWTQTELWRALKVQSGTLSNVIRGRVISRHVAEAIAAITGTSVAELFPDVDYGARQARPSYRERVRAALEAARHG